MKLLDLFCGAGGAAMGYYRAGFTDIVGVDIKPQKHYPYPFEFVQGDALEYVAEHGTEFDAIHASPPCQAYSVTRNLHKRSYPDLVGITRESIRLTGKPYVIENVPGSPLINPLMLCGTMFGLKVIRHRLFESNTDLGLSPASCNHNGTVSGNRSLCDGKRVTPCLNKFDYITVTGHDFILADARIAMGIDWMGQNEISQAIPPAYTEWIGSGMLRRLEKGCNRRGDGAW